jgi:hypothetical protein
MNDWWNDPPEDEEYPPCPRCGADETDIVVVYAADGDSGEMFACSACGHRWPIPVQDDPGPEDFFDDRDFMQSFTVPEKCPHGREWGECGDCDHEGDLAYDAARERRIFRR